MRKNKSKSAKVENPPLPRIPKIKCDFPGCNGVHVPNEETKQAMRDVDEEKNLGHAITLEEFWSAIGLDPNA
jgi:hypothetical protein